MVQGKIQTKGSFYFLKYFSCMCIKFKKLTIKAYEDKQPPAPAHYTPDSCFLGATILILSYISFIYLHIFK